MSDGRAALLLIQTNSKEKTQRLSELPLGGWIWSGDPDDAAPVAFTVITHPDLAAFFAGGAVLLQLGHRVLLQEKEWEEISGDIELLWTTIDVGSPLEARTYTPKYAMRAAARSLRIPKAHGDAGYKYRIFEWQRPAASDRSITANLQAALAIASNAECRDDWPVPRRPSPHVIELHTAAQPAGVRSQDEISTLRRVDKLLQELTQRVERARQADPFLMLDDRLQVAMLHLYQRKAFTKAEAVAAKDIVSTLSSERSRRNLPEIRSRANDLTKLIAPHRPKWIGSVRGKDGGYFLALAGRRLVIAALDRLDLDGTSPRWPGGGTILTSPSL